MFAEDLEELRRALELDGPAAGPKPTRSLRSRGSPLAPPAGQLALLEGLGLPGFGATVEAALGPLCAAELEILQVNVGRLCNLACRHCHVDAGPDRTVENMDGATLQACLDLLDRTGAHTVDVTGGAPELNPHFRELVDACLRRGRHVIDRCNLTVLLLPRFADLPAWLAERGVEVVASLPHYRSRNTDAQRGEGTFARSMEAIRRLNAVGYGAGDPRRRLTLMHNPAGAFLAADQCALERQYRQALEREHGVRFDRLVALNNMPVARFLEWLVASGNLDAYARRLVEGFNPAAVAGLMCRNTLSVGWDGTLFDCDFNQMLDLPVRHADGRRVTVFDADPDALVGRPVVTRQHCYGCTAGAGSSCGGRTVP